MKLIRTVHLTAGQAERLRLAKEIFHLIKLDFRLLIFNSIRQPAVNEVLQESDESRRSRVARPKTLRITCFFP